MLKQKNNNLQDYDFTIIFWLDNPNVDPSNYLDRLYESGCDDATVGTGLEGRISLSFIRQANDFKEAKKSAINDVLKAIPTATLFGVIV